MRVVRDTSELTTELFGGIDQNGKDSAGPEEAVQKELEQEYVPGSSAAYLLNQPHKRESQYRPGDIR